MKKVLHHIISLMFLITMGFGLSSCDKDEKPGSGKIEFTFVGDNLQSALKSATIGSTATYIVVTIENNNGEIVKNSEKLELYNMSGYFISQPVSITTGNYKLTRFMVLDADNNVLYASPLKSSEKAYLVHNPLPFAFSIENDKTTKLVPEVLNATGSTPESFGYTTFSYSIFGTFDFLIGTFFYNESLANFEMIAADISIYSDSTLVYSGKLNSVTNSTNVGVYDSLGVTNKITLPERYNNYTIVISQSGFETYTKTFTKDGLKLHYYKIDKGPLVVVIKPKQQDYYIRGNFGGEYLSFSVDTSLYFGNAHILSIVAYKNISTSDWSFSMYFERSLTSTAIFDIDNLAIPNTITKTRGDIMAGFFFTKDSALLLGPPEKDTVNHMAIIGFSENYINFTIIIDKISNDIIEGRFFGDLETDLRIGSKIIVTNGEFRSKFSRVSYDPWWYKSSATTKKQYKLY